MKIWNYPGLLWSARKGLPGAIQYLARPRKRRRNRIAPLLAGAGIALAWGLMRKRRRPAPAA